MNFLNSVEQWLKSRHVSIGKEWVKACVQWVEEESEGRNVTVEELKTAVYEQWLLSDLREIGSSSFPPDLASLQKTVLNGNYTVQVMGVRDVSQSAYGQLLKLQGKENENVKVSADPENYESKWEPKAKRMLMLNITDGSQHVQAMEYQSIPSLSVEMPPGIKLLISGSIECRLGVVFLTSEKVQVLGGDVESLVEVNQYQKILARQLNKDGTDLVFGSQQHSSPIASQPAVVPHTPPPVAPRPLSDDVPDENTVAIDPDFDDDDQMFMDLSPDFLDDLEQKAMENESKKDEISDTDINELNSIADFPDEWDDEEFDSMSVQESPSNLQSKCDSIKPACVNRLVENDDLLAKDSTTSEIKLSCRNRLSKNRHSEIKDSTIDRKNLRTDLTTSETCGNVLNVQPINEESAVLGWDSAPFTYLHCAMERKSPLKQFVIKGFITSLTSKLLIKEDSGWSLQALINDGSASIEMHIADEVLSKFIGLTAEVVAKLKVEAKTDVDVKMKIIEAMTKCQNTLMNLNCLMKIQLEPEPILLQCIPLEKYHIYHLLNRVLATV